MSGLEIIGIAASVLQIAELGGRLISQDIAATGAVLQELGNTLKKDDQTRLCSDEAVATTRMLVAGCHKVFAELNDTLDGSGSGSKLVLGWKQRLKYPFLEPQIDLLRTNLERLKSSLLVILNVLVFAEQIKNRETLPILRDQRALVEVLIEDNAANNIKFDQVMKRLEGLGMSDSTEDQNRSKNTASQEFNINTVTLNHNVATEHPDRPKPSSKTFNPIPLYRLEEIVDHSHLVSELIQKIKAAQWKINHGLRHNLHERILDVHWHEWSNLREVYGEDALLQTFSRHHDVLRFWTSKTEKEELLTNWKCNPRLFDERLDQIRRGSAKTPKTEYARLGLTVADFDAQRASMGQQQHPGQLQQLPNNVFSGGVMVGLSPMQRSHVPEGPMQYPQQPQSQPENGLQMLSSQEAARQRYIQLSQLQQQQLQNQQQQAQAHAGQQQDMRIMFMQDRMTKMAQGMTPQQVAQMKLAQQQQSQMIQPQQMQRDGSDMGTNVQRPSTPADGEIGGSPSKRPRLDGQQQFNSGMIPNGWVQDMPYGNQQILMQSGFNTASMNQERFRQNGAFQQESMQHGLMANSINMTDNTGSPMIGNIDPQFNLAGMGSMEGINHTRMPDQSSMPDPAAQSGKHTLQDYQMQLMLLEQQNKKRLMMARAEQDSIAAGDNDVPMPGQADIQPPGMAPSSSIAGASLYPRAQMKRANAQMRGNGSPLAAYLQSRGSPVNFMHNKAPDINTALFMNSKDRVVTGGPGMRQPNMEFNSLRAQQGRMAYQFPPGQPMGFPGQQNEMSPASAPAVGGSAQKAQPSSPKSGATPVYQPPLLQSEISGEEAANTTTLECFNSHESFNLDFGTPENPDVLEDFDFGSFLNGEGAGLDSGLDTPESSSSRRREREGPGARDEDAHGQDSIDGVEALIMKYTTSLTAEEIAATRP